MRGNGAPRRSAVGSTSRSSGQLTPRRNGRRRRNEEWEEMHHGLLTCVASGQKLSHAFSQPRAVQKGREGNLRASGAAREAAGIVGGRRSHPSDFRLNHPYTYPILSSVFSFGRCRHRWQSNENGARGVQMLNGVLCQKSWSVEILRYCKVDRTSLPYATYAADSA